MTTFLIRKELITKIEISNSFQLRKLKKKSFQKQSNLKNRNRKNSKVLVRKELNFCKIRGPVCFGKAGLKKTGVAVEAVKGTYECRKLVSSVSNEIDLEEDRSKALHLQVQGRWNCWEDCIKNDFF